MQGGGRQTVLYAACVHNISVFLPHLLLYEVVSLHTCALPYKYRKILGMLRKLTKLCEIMGAGLRRVASRAHPLWSWRRLAHPLWSWRRLAHPLWSSLVVVSCGGLLPCFPSNTLCGGLLVFLAAL